MHIYLLAMGNSKAYTVNKIEPPPSFKQQRQAGNSNRNCCNNCSWKSLAKIIFTSLLLLFLIVGFVAQLMTCFRRDSPAITKKNLTSSENSSTTKRLIMSCDEDNQIIGGILIPDAIILLLAVWVY